VCSSRSISRDLRVAYGTKIQVEMLRAQYWYVLERIRHDSAYVRRSLATSTECLFWRGGVAKKAKRGIAASSARHTSDPRARGIQNCHTALRTSLLLLCICSIRESSVKPFCSFSLSLLQWWVHGMWRCSVVMRVVYGGPQSMRHHCHFSKQAGHKSFLSVLGTQFHLIGT
jgi:hypothetical protein